VTVELTLRNTAPGMRTIHGPDHRPLDFRPGETRTVVVTAAMATFLERHPDLRILDEVDEFLAAQAARPPPRPDGRQPLVVLGMQGLGDNLHQRAILRVLMREHEVTLATCHGMLYHDLVEDGLALAFQRSHLRTQAKTQAREISLLRATLPRGARSLRIFSSPGEIIRHGSILAAMFASAGLVMPERPDFSLPVPEAWHVALRKRLPPIDRPILVHRPVVLRREWDARSRNPDVTAYDTLFRSIRDRYFVVSVADLDDGQEWIEGPEQQVDLAWHRGELDFAHMAGLFAEAELVFCNAGFAAILAQAVGTPVVCVYGGRESFRTTARAGAHLAPTLGIDPDRPCDCYSHRHACDKRISLGPALERLAAFVVGADRLANPEVVPDFQKIENNKGDSREGADSAHHPKVAISAMQPRQPSALRQIRPVGAPAPVPPPGSPPSPQASVRPSIAALGHVSRVGIVVGGAEGCLEELATAVELCGKTGQTPVLVVVNDTIPLVPGPIVAASLHHHKIREWLRLRSEAGYPPPFEFWGWFRPPAMPHLITHVISDWQGSSGLLGVAVALQRGHERVICAGVPMEPSAGHIVRRVDWTDCHRYRKGWDEHMHQLSGRVRSLSGWTAARLGVPTAEWLQP
jgi:hypothetical protein